MFREIRFQTGESKEVASEMEKGNIPCIDVNDMDEFVYFANKLEHFGFKLDKEIPLDKKARDGIKEPEFEFRAAFKHEKHNKTMYLDVYFEPDIERTYDNVGEM